MAAGDGPYIPSSDPRWERLHHETVPMVVYHPDGYIEVDVGESSFSLGKVPNIEYLNAEQDAQGVEDRCAHALAGEHLAVELEGAAGIRRSRADHAARRIEGGLGGPLGCADPLQLASILAPPAGQKQLPVRGQRDALAT